MLPTVIMGSFLGVLMNSLLPDLYLQVILLCLQTFLCWQIGSKFISVYKKENAQINAEKEKFKI